MTHTTLYYCGSVLTENDYPEIAQKFRIPFPSLETAIQQIMTKGEPIYSQFPSAIRENVRKFAASVSFSPQEEECVVVDGTKPEPPTEASVEASPVVVDDVAQPQPEEPVEALAPQDAPLSEEESFDPSPVAEVDDVTEHAATALIQAMTMGEAHFIITDEGICSINPDSPPDLMHSYQIIQNVIRLGGLGDRIKDKQCWMLGSMVASLEEFHGENFNIGQVCEQTEKSENTIRQAVSVFKKFKVKRYNLSYSHHQEAYHIDVPFKTTCLLLHKAEKFGLSAKDVRSLGSIAKTMGDDTVIKNIKSAKQAEDLIAAYKETKVPYVIFENGEMARVTGLANELPEGRVVIDLKNWKWYADGKLAGEIPKRGKKSSKKNE